MGIDDHAGPEATQLEEHGRDLPVVGGREVVRGRMDATAPNLKGGEGRGEERVERLKKGVNEIQNGGSSKGQLGAVSLGERKSR